MDISTSDPIITNLTQDNKFYMKIEYPSHEIKLRFPYNSDCITYKYVFKSIEEFIEELGKDEGMSYLQLASNFYIYLSEYKIRFEHKKIHIKIKNTQFIRDNLIDVLISYLEYLASNL